MTNPVMRHEKATDDKPCDAAREGNIWQTLRCSRGMQQMTNPAMQQGKAVGVCMSHMIVHKLNALRMCMCYVCMFMHTYTSQMHLLHIHPWIHHVLCTYHVMHTCLVRFCTHIATTDGHPWHGPPVTTSPLRCGRVLSLSQEMINTYRAKTFT